MVFIAALQAFSLQIFKSERLVEHRKLANPSRSEQDGGKHYTNVLEDFRDPTRLQNLTLFNIFSQVSPSLQSYVC